MHQSRDELTRRWLDRIAARVTLDPSRIFPTDALLDHVPILIDGIATYIENPAEDVTTDVPVIAKAMELGDMRHEQGFDAYQIFKEYEILGSVLFSFLAREADAIDVACTREELLQCGHRVFQAVALIQQATAMQFLRQAQGRVRDREDRLRRFNRMVSHELKNRLGSADGAVSLLNEQWLDEKGRERFLGIVSRNLGMMKQVLEDLVSLSRLDARPTEKRNVRLSEAVAEVRRRLREFARARGVAIEVKEPMPEVEVDAAAIELCLTNYISNAVKYSDPKKPRCWVRVEAHVAPPRADGRGAEINVLVSDNGLGVPPSARSHLFERFFRAHEGDGSQQVEGTGLGLSIVRETIADLGGRVWAEANADGGETFGLAIPARRQAELTSRMPSERVPDASPLPGPSSA